MHKFDHPPAHTRASSNAATGYKSSSTEQEAQQNEIAHEPHKERPGEQAHAQTGGLRNSIHNRAMYALDMLNLLLAACETNLASS